MNPNDQLYINVSEDDALFNAVSVKKETTSDFMKRSDALDRIRANMQEWHELRTEGGKLVQK